MPRAHSSRSSRGFSPSTGLAQRALVRAAFLVLAMSIAGPVAADSIFDTAAGHTLFAEVLRAASFGVRDAERAAFIVETDDGSLQCELWPATWSLHAESFRGTIPPRTVAIIHTHPVEWPLPSAHDVQEAARLDMAMYVLSLRAVYRINPHSSKPDAIVHGHLWFDDAREERYGHCRQLAR